MPMPGDESNGKQPGHAPANDCSQMAVCAPSIPVIAPAVAQLTVTYFTAHPQYLNPATLLPGDATAPPQPPPIV